MPNAFYGIVSGLARPSDIKNLGISQEGKLDEIYRLLNRLIEIEEENFRRRWGEDFKPKSIDLSMDLSNHPLLPSNNTSKVALPVGTTTTTTTTKPKSSLILNHPLLPSSNTNKVTLPLNMKKAEDNTKG